MNNLYIVPYSLPNAYTARLHHTRNCNDSPLGLLFIDTITLSYFAFRYMAPEVALNQPYTEKVDVYSFGILLWQIARDKVPFQGFDKYSFYRDVVSEGERPKLSRR